MFRIHGAVLPILSVLSILLIACVRSRYRSSLPRIGKRGNRHVCPGLLSFHIGIRILIHSVRMVRVIVHKYLAHFHISV